MQEHELDRLDKQLQGVISFQHELFDFPMDLAADFAEAVAADPVGIAMDGLAAAGAANLFNAARNVRRRMSDDGATNGDAAQRGTDPRPPAAGSKGFVGGRIMGLSKKTLGTNRKSKYNPFFAMTPRAITMKYEFAFSLNAAAGLREWGMTHFRHNKGNYYANSPQTLSPAQVDSGISSTRKLNVNYRDLFSQINLDDMCVSSWNANPFKIRTDNSGAALVTYPGIGPQDRTSTAASEENQVYQVYTHGTATGAGQYGPLAAPVNRPYALSCAGSSGEVAFTIQNTADIAIVVTMVRIKYKRKFDLSNSGGFPVLSNHVSDVTANAWMFNRQATPANVTLGGVPPSGHDVLTNPNVTFLPNIKLDQPSSGSSTTGLESAMFKQEDRYTYVIPAGNRKSVVFALGGWQVSMDNMRTVSDGTTGGVTRLPMADPENTVSFAWACAGVTTPGVNSTGISDIITAPASCIVYGRHRETTTPCEFKHRNVRSNCKGDRYVEADLRPSLLVAPGAATRAAGLPGTPAAAAWTTPASHLTT